MSDDLPLAKYLKLAAGFHIVCVLADPAHMTRTVFCSCGWKSEPEKWPFDFGNYENLAPQVKSHFEQALTDDDEEAFERRRDRFFKTPASNFVKNTE